MPSDATGLFCGGQVQVQQKEQPKMQIRFVVLDLETLSKNIPRDENGKVDSAVRAAILASVHKKIDIQLALNVAETCYYRAKVAYQFGAGSYTHDALVACVEAKNILDEMLSAIR
jgi:hypothetical protein